MDTQFIKAKIEELLHTLSMDATVEVKYDEDIHMTVFAISMEEAQVLIGYRGETLSALSHIVKKIADKHEEVDKNDAFIVDVNDYQKRRVAELKDKAMILAERARYFKSSVEMDPMSPYERMIIHAIFSEDRELSTESAGRGRERHVVIRFTEKTDSPL